MKDVKTPVNYQEWLEAFTYIRKHPTDRAGLKALGEGTINISNAALLDSFLTRMDETLSEVIACRIRAFLSDIDRLFEDFDYDGVGILGGRFVESISDCFFFQSLREIPLDNRRELAKGYGRQIEEFWNRFLAELRADADEKNDFYLDELVYQLSRLHINMKGDPDE